LYYDTAIEYISTDFIHSYSIVFNDGDRSCHLPSHVKSKILFGKNKHVHRHKQYIW